MVTIIQVKDFLSSRQIKERYLGCFFSLERAENALGWYFVHSVCRIARF